MTIHKVTAFITREAANGRQLLLFRHPQAGVQIPAGTVDEGEDWQTAALREAAEETGLTHLTFIRDLGGIENELAANEAVLNRACQVLSQPDDASLPFAPWFSRGMTVTVGDKNGRFRQIGYTEYDQLPNPNKITLYIDGWLPESCLCFSKTRHYAHLRCQQPTPDSWTHPSDRGHTFALFWADLVPQPAIIPPQDRWLDDVYARLQD